MIGPSGAVKVMVATRPVDFRKGAEGLAALVKAEMGADPFSGTIYVFRAKRADRIKLVFWDGSGVCLVSKRLEDGEFHWPRMQDGAMRLTAAQFSALFEGWIGDAFMRRSRRGFQRRRDSRRDQLNQAHPRPRFGRRNMLLSLHDDDRR
ncbi:IS66 family insertion sequence element accessory protein TnpB [Sinorhizobium meliloti]|nr:IS66 family insertion sequence element accessory protein TnpB [Sinorhizobium meliloti]MDW9664827.1 IS66 family insertion sequence element accessory protein TnpB [Sinorhizobium meliloti]MDX0054655.1 IS66 family insertion sequence element accessory protein TnpB [Sinorhizobium meliloti]